MKYKEFILFGLDKHKEIINKIITDLSVGYNNDTCFDIRLILTEALTNAFKHGNKRAKDKPIYLKYTYDDTNVIFEIKDSGDGIDNVIIPDEASDESLLNDCGRGLFLIKCIADKVEHRKDKLIIQKYLTTQG